MQNDAKTILIWIGEVVRTARNAKKVSQEWLAEEVGSTARTSISVEQGDRDHNFSLIKAIADILQIPPDLLFRKGKIPPNIEQELFVKEFLEASEEEQSTAMEVCRIIWRKHDVFHQD